MVSGTYYVTAPPGAGAIKFEDPRLGLMMAAPAKKENARLENATIKTCEAAIDRLGENHAP